MTERVRMATGRTFQAKPEAAHEEEAGLEVADDHANRHERCSLNAEETVAVRPDTACLKALQVFHSSTQKVREHRRGHRGQHGLAALRRRFECSAHAKTASKTGQVDTTIKTNLSVSDWCGRGASASNTKSVTSCPPP
jgi:hypothetical protein